MYQSRSLSDADVVAVRLASCKVMHHTNIHATVAASRVLAVPSSPVEEEYYTGFSNSDCDLAIGAPQQVPMAPTPTHTSHGIPTQEAVGRIVTAYAPSTTGSRPLRGHHHTHSLPNGSIVNTSVRPSATQPNLAQKTSNTHFVEWKDRCPALGIFAAPPPYIVVESAYGKDSNFIISSTRALVAQQSAIAVVTHYLTLWGSKHCLTCFILFGISVPHNHPVHEDINVCSQAMVKAHQLSQVPSSQALEQYVTRGQYNLTDVHQYRIFKKLPVPFNVSICYSCNLPNGTTTPFHKYQKWECCNGYLLLTVFWTVINQLTPQCRLLLDRLPPTAPSPANHTAFLFWTQSIREGTAYTNGLFVFADWIHIILHSFQQHSHV
jgi:hypothetical protein